MIRYPYTIAIVLIIGYLAWPYGTLLRFYLALKSGDETVVEQMVNWPSVHASIEQGINRSTGDYLNHKMSANSGSPVKLKLSFDSVSIANDIATSIATPKSFIFLFNHADKFHCIWNPKTPDIAPKAYDCDISDSKQNNDDQNSSELRGPNFSRLYEKTNFLFFTDPFTFKFDVQHEDIRLVLIFARQSFNWKLVTLIADWDQALKKLNQDR